METNIYTVGGTVQAGEGLYIERNADAELLELCRNGEFAYILNARQMGKSSIVAHTAERLLEEDIRPVVIDLTLIGTELNADQWYLGLLTIIADQLDLATNPTVWWRDRAHLGVIQRLAAFIQDVLLEEVAEPIVIFVDEIDTTLRLDFTDDFYAAIRALYNARAQQPELRRIGVVLIGVATPGDLIKDPQRTPFNIGRQVTLTDFTLPNVQPFAKGLNLPMEQADIVLRRVMYWTSGHPYLTQLLCHSISERHDESWNAAAVDRLIHETLLGERRKQDNNLQFVHDMLTRRAPDPIAVLTTYRAIRQGRTVRDEERSLVKSHLKLSGVVRRKGDLLLIRNNIYDEAFNERWIHENLPNDWTRRALRVTRFALAVVAVIAVALGVFLFISNSISINEIQAKNKELEAQFATASALQNQLELSGTAIVLSYQKGQRQQLSEEVEALALRSKSIGEAAKNPELGLLLAIEAAQQVANNRADDLNGSVKQALVKAIQNMPTGANIAFIGTVPSNAQEIVSAAWSPDGTRFLTASHHTINVWDAKSGTPIAAFSENYGQNIIDASWSPNSSHILIVFAHIVQVWDVSSKQPSTVSQDNIKSAAWAADGSRIFIRSDDGTIQVWDASLKNKIGTIHAGKPRIADAFWSPDATRILTLSDGGIARIWDVSSGSQLRAFETQDAIAAAAWSPDGKYIATVGFIATTESPCIWDSSSGQLVVGTISFLEPDPQNECRLSSNQNTTEGQEISNAILRRYSSPSSVSWSHNGKQVVQVNTGHAVIIDISSKKVVRLITSQAYDIKWVKWSPDDMEMLLILSDGTVQIQKAQSNQLLGTIKNDTSEIVSADWSPDGTRVLTRAKDGTVSVWSGALDRLIDLARSHLSKINGVTRTLTPMEREVYGADRLEATPVGRP